MVWATAARAGRRRPAGTGHWGPSGGRILNLYAESAQVRRVGLTNPIVKVKSEVFSNQPQIPQ